MFLLFCKNIIVKTIDKLSINKSIYKVNDAGLQNFTIITGSTVIQFHKEPHCHILNLY